MPVTPRILSIASTRLEAWRIAPPEQPYWRLYWNDATGASIETRYERIALGPDRVVLISPGTWFKGHLAQPVQHTFIHALFGHPGDSARNIAVALPLNADERARAAGLPHHRNPLACEMTALALLTHAATAIPSDAWPQPPADQRIAQAQTTIIARLHDPPSNAELAAAAGMHQHSFERLFRQNSTMSPHAWGLDRRLDEACRMLLHDDLPIATIAHLCGFADHRHLGGPFARRFGRTPQSFRRQRGLPLTGRIPTR